MLKKTDYYHINTLIDWNINNDVYASLCAAKYCASAVKSRKKLNSSSHCMGGLLPTHMGGRLMGEGHSWLSSPWPTNDASFASFSTLWVALYGRFDRIFCFHFCVLSYLQPFRTATGPSSPYISDIHEGNTDNHSPVCRHLTRWTHAK